jgi:hypothetical protein
MDDWGLTILRFKVRVASYAVSETKPWFWQCGEAQLVLNPEHNVKLNRLGGITGGHWPSAIRSNFHNCLLLALILTGTLAQFN